MAFSDVLSLFVVMNHLGPGLYRKAVFQAWDEASGASKYTSNRFLKDGVLYITLSSSVVRSQLMFQKDFILLKINDMLRKSETVGLSGIKEEVKEIRLR